MSAQSEARKAVKAEHPGLKFKIRKVGFSDLARGERFFLESDAWGMCVGNHDLFDSVSATLKKLDLPITVSW